MNSQIRKALFINGLSSSDVAKKFELPLTTVEVAFRQFLDLNKADTPKHLKVYEHLIFGGLSPSQIARRMNTGEEDIRGILLDLDRENEVSESDSETFPKSTEVSAFNMILTDTESEENNSLPATNGIRFFLQYEKDADDDFDILRIQKQAGNTYEVKYSYNHKSYSQRDVVTTMSEDKLTDYLINTFDLLATDKRPFYSVEVQIPLYPTIKLTVDQLNEEFPTLMEAIYHSQTF